MCAKSLQSRPTLRPYWLQPAWFHCPWDSPGKNTGVGCYALLQRIFPTEELTSCLFCLLYWQADSSPLAPRGKHISTYTYVAMLVLVTQSCLNHGDRLEPASSSVHGIFQARILERVAIPFSKGSSRLRDQTQFSCIAGRFFTVWYIHICIGTKLSPRTLSSISALTGVLCDSPHSSVGEASTCNAGDPGSIPGLGRSAGEGIGYPLQYSLASLVAELVKTPPAMQETWVQSLGGKDPLEKEMAMHSSILSG